MTREELRAALVERAVRLLHPDWDECVEWVPKRAARFREETGQVIDALGVLDAAEALEWAIPMASSHVEHLARQPSGHQEFIREERDELKKAQAALHRVRGEP